MKENEKLFYAALGAYVMLARIANHESFTVLEFTSNMHVYREAILAHSPQMVDDPWFGKFLQQYG